jgi:hypothetical protein
MNAIHKPASASASAAETKFDWPVCHEAEQFILDRLAAFTARHAFARALEERMLNETGTLLLDWTDALTLPASGLKALRAVGYVEDAASETPASLRPFWHPEAMLPAVLVEREGHGAGPDTLALRCESVADFMVAHGLTTEPEGAPLSRFRRVLVREENGARLEAIERRGYRGQVPLRHSAGAAELLQAAELWRTRRRQFDEDAAGWRQSLALLDRIIQLVGRDLACHVVFAEERGWWQRRNHAARVQKARQDALGLGWANHDHHTFRCSRRHFVDLMSALERLGFQRRERYYAGEQAGWGAQILEQPVEGIVTFCDVDLLPHETEIDFSRQPLPPAPKLGTIGLWVGLHGESFLEAGLHHLECRFDYARLREQLAAAGVKTMNPFSDFPFLKQAFTEGERWPVRRERAELLLQAGLITAEQCRQFTAEGAIGSHLENLQRKGGFKGFNQKSVSAIISATDPRKQAAHA